MNENLESTDICTQLTNFKAKYKEVVQIIVQARKEAGLGQIDTADWIEVDRRKIIEFEKAEKINIELLLILCENFSIDLELKYKIN